MPFRVWGVGIEVRVYLEGQGTYMGRLITPISQIVTLVIPHYKPTYLLSHPDPPDIVRGCGPGSFK